MAPSSIYRSLIAMSATFIAPILPYLQEHNPRVYVHLANDAKLKKAGYVNEFYLHPHCERLTTADFSGDFYKTSHGQSAIRGFGDEYRNAAHIAILYSRIGHRQSGLTGIGSRDVTGLTAGERSQYAKDLRERPGVLPPRPQRLLTLMEDYPGYGYNTNAGHARTALKNNVWAHLETLDSFRRLSDDQIIVRDKYFPGSGRGEVIACVIKCLETPTGGHNDLYWTSRHMQVRNICRVCGSCALVLLLCQHALARL